MSGHWHHSMYMTANQYCRFTSSYHTMVSKSQRLVLGNIGNITDVNAEHYSLRRGGGGGGVGE